MAVHRLLDALVMFAGVAIVGAPVIASAANGLRPRTPAVFPADVPCVQTVPRGEVMHIDYAAPFDDTDLGADELPDSRRYQFFAFAQQRDDFELPLWISRADWDRADANGDIMTLGDRPILEEDASWPPDTWVRITPDDARLPITIEQSALGVDWDTGATPPGTWLVAAYTWEPEQNLWTPRFGAVRIVDPAQPDASGPTGFFAREDPPIVRVGDSFAPAGCIDAPPGSTIDAAWGSVTGGQAPQWITFASDVPVVTGPLALTWTPGEDAIGSVRLRIEITDPTGRSYVAFTPSKIGVIAALDDGGDGSSSSSSETSTGSDGTTGAGAVDPGPHGCACNGEGRDRSAIAALPILVVVCHRRRAQARGSSPTTAS